MHQGDGSVDAIKTNNVHEVRIPRFRLTATASSFQIYIAGLLGRYRPARLGDPSFPLLEKEKHRYKYQCGLVLFCDAYMTMRQSDLCYIFSSISSTDLSEVLFYTSIIPKNGSVSRKPAYLSPTWFYYI